MTQQTRSSRSKNESTFHIGWPADPQDNQSNRYGMHDSGPYETPGTQICRVAEDTRHSAGMSVHCETALHARRPLPHGYVSGGTDEGVEAETLQMDPWRGQNRRNLNSPLPSRDRAATIARPLHRELTESFTEQGGVGDRFDTIFIVPPASQQTVLGQGPHYNRSSSRKGVTPIRVARSLVITLLLYYALSSSLQLAGLSGLPLAPFLWAASSGAASGVAAAFPLRMDGRVASRVQPMTQMRRVDLYDSRAQFEQWRGAACSAASLAEILTAYGLPHMTIGRMIRELGPDISPQSGLLTYNALNKVVARYGLRADLYLDNNALTYKQMLYLTNTLGIPVVINMRATTGYYHFLSGGHILVMTGGDSKTIRLADSSLYYMKSLPLSTYNQMARPRNVVIVPKDYHYTLPR